ncbi:MULTISPECIES: hypothetical protein [unclassified Variovorax]|uniref:hypothetical protein n=1 Tax=unclassified Variovorax TaxID=663243 RepID=UPI0015A592C0|nr:MULTISPECIES: hypothetical protein [unclassified Variovorax]
MSAMFKVRASVGENTMTAGELSAIGVTPEAIALAVSSAPCSWVATIDEEVVGFESPRILWRLNTLRGLSHEEVEQVFT